MLISPISQLHGSRTVTAWDHSGPKNPSNTIGQTIEKYSPSCNSHKFTCILTQIAIIRKCTINMFWCYHIYST